MDNLEISKQIKKAFLEPMIMEGDHEKGIKQAIKPLENDFIGYAAYLEYLDTSKGNIDLSYLVFAYSKYDFGNSNSTIPIPAFKLHYSNDIAAGTLNIAIDPAYASNRFKYFAKPLIKPSNAYLIFYGLDKTDGLIMLEGLLNIDLLKGEWWLEDYNYNLPEKHRIPTVANYYKENIPACLQDGNIPNADDIGEFKDQLTEFVKPLAEGILKSGVTKIKHLELGRFGIQGDNVGAYIIKEINY